MKNKMLIPVLSTAAILPFMYSNVYANALGEVNTEKLNVRESYTIHSKAMFTVNKGEKVEILDQQEGWFKIKTQDNKSGWVNSKYISASSKARSIQKKTSTNLNVRKGPSTSYSILGTLKKGTEVSVISESNGWSKINYNGKEAYVSSKYLVNSNNSATINNVSNTGKVYKTDSLNVRSGPSTSYKIIDKLSKNETVNIYESKNGWYRISSNGWVSGNYISLNTNSVTNTNTSTPSTNKSGVIHTYDVHLRDDDNYSATSLCVIKKNTTVEVLSTNSTWTKVKYNGKEGYVLTKYVNINQTSTNTTPSNPSTPAPTPTPSTPETKPEQSVPSVTTKKGTVHTYDVNARTIPSYSGENVGVVKKNTTVDIYETKNGWHKVKVNGKDGWIVGTYVNVTNGTSTTPSTPAPTPTPSNPTENIINSGVVYKTDSLNVRKGASTSYAVMGTITRGTKVDIYETKNGWHRIKYNNQNGWVSGSYIDTNKSSNESSNEVVQGYGYVSTNIAPIRSSKSTSVFNSNVLFKVKENTKVEILEKDSVWTKVKYNNKVGYMRTDHLDANAKDKLREEVVSLARQQLGKPYVYGNYGPNSFDCSGLVAYIYNELLGFSLERTSNSQSQTSGELVDRKDLLPGDLVFFDPNKDGVVTHVGIYIGDGKMIHSPNSNDVVKIASIETGYYKNGFHNARRVI